MNDRRVDIPRILAALGSREDCSSLERILDGDNWHVHIELSFREAEAALLARPFGVVISPAGFDDGHRWTDVLNCVRGMPIPPVLIVADRLADESLWAHVLNLGAYDLLATPFEREEVLRVLENALIAGGETTSPQP